MPANLPAEAQKALAKYQAAKTIEGKIKALEEALSLIPAHKGTEKLRGRIRRRISELRRMAERKAAAKPGRRDYFSIPKEGAAQIALIGAANSGKSSILKALTNAKPLVAPYQLTTTKPTPGMMLYDDVELQLVELPAILTEELEETSFTGRSIGFAKNSDLILIVIDSSKDPITQFKKIVELLDEFGVTIRPKRCRIEVERKDSGGIRLVVFGKLKASYREASELLRSMGIRNAVVKIWGEADLSDLEDSILRELIFKKAVVVFNKIDAADRESLTTLEKFLERNRISFVEISAENGSGTEILKKLIFNTLGLIRIYTQRDGVRAEKPIVVGRGCTVREIARIIHRELAEKMRYARVWGKSVKIQGQQVGPEHILEDGDVIEIFT
ncbi:MAG TPA: TGS domain-containing protein [Nitrososphaeria archaeon]|nr:TGS domain-containing protein [Nitrososphaeria archaeon]